MTLNEGGARTTHWNLQGKGVSVHHLCTDFLDTVIAKGYPRSAKVYEIERDVIRAAGAVLLCPRDGRVGCAYVDAINSEAVGLADVMLSYTWAYGIGEIVDSLRRYCEKSSLDVHTTRVWLCCLCINQHRVVERTAAGKVVPPNEFRAEFESRVVGIGRVLAMFSPWTQPNNLKRVWCIFEIFMALQLGESRCKLEIIMPPSEESSFNDALQTDFDRIVGILSDVDVEKANASVVADKDSILQLVRNGMGFTAVNQAVVAGLRDWLLEMATMALENFSPDERGTSVLIRSLGGLLQKLGKRDQAEPLCCEALAACQDTLGDTHPSTLTALNNLGRLWKDQGKLQEAEPLCQEAVTGRIALLGRRHPDTLMSMNNLAMLLKDLGRLEEAEELFRETAEVRTLVLGEADPNTFNSTNNLAMTLKELGRLEEAADIIFQEVERSCAALGDRHPSSMALMSTMMVVLQEQGKVEEAEAICRTTLAIRRATLGDDHPTTLNNEGNLGVLLMMRDGCLNEGREVIHSVVEKLTAAPHSYTDSHPLVVKFNGALENIENMATVVKQ